MVRPIAAAAVVSTLLAGSIRAAGAPSAALEPEERAAIVALFEEAGRLMSDGQTADACAKLESARRLDASALGVLLRLGACYEADHRLASAHAQYLEAMGVARRLHDPRATLAEERAAAIAPRLSYLRVTVDRALAPSSLELRVDGSKLVPEAWGVPVPMNQGLRSISARVAGKPVWSTTIEIAAERERHELEIPVRGFSPDAERGTEHAPAPPANAGQAIPTSPRHTGGAEPGPQLVAGWVLGASGLAAVGVGLGFAIRYAAAASASADHCDADDFCDETGLELRRDAIDAQTAGLSIGVPGAALAGVGLALALTAAPGDDADGAEDGVSIRIGPGSVSLHGQW